MVVLNTRTILRVFLLTCLASYLIGCAQSLSSNTENDHPSYTQQQALSQAAKFMHLAQQSDEQQAATFRLQAVEQLLAADNIAQAEYTLHDDAATKNLDKHNHAFKQIIRAKLDLAKHNIPGAKQHLSAIAAPTQLPEHLLIKFYMTKAEIYQRADNPLDAAKERIYLNKYLPTPEERNANNKVIWDLLLQLTPNTLRAVTTDTTKTELNGWLQFAGITKQYDSSPEQMHSALKNWHIQYPNHPAKALLAQYADKGSSSDFVDSTKALHTPQKIALILPLQGNHAKSAKAVRDGFLAAFYAHKTANKKPTIQVYDTTVEPNLAKLYKQIMADGTDFIVGPLTKEEVDLISNTVSPQVPMLALNSSNKTSATENILQFSLSPELEAQAVARKAWHDGHRSALIIIPKSVWGKRMLTAFEQTWIAMGGKIIGIERIESQAELTQGIKHLLAIDQSEERAQRLKSLGIKFTFDPRRRQDVDMVFIGTNAALARQVKPLLNFYFAGNLPAYASSSIFTGKVQPNIDQDLNGIQFCDMPWILDQSIDTKNTYQAIAELWPDDFEQYARLYALGLDAYKIALQINKLTTMPELGISGMTGMLTLNQRRTIERKLIWASFKKGQPYVNGEKF